MADYINDLFPKDIYDLYNERLIADEPPTECIIASIKYQIYDIITEGFLPYSFIYDADEWLFLCDDLQKTRVLDQVIKYFRSRGIRCYINNVLKFNEGTSLEGAGFVYPTTLSTILKVEWFVRQGQEYMKAYYY